MTSNQTSSKTGTINVHFNRAVGKKTNAAITLPVTIEKLKTALVDAFGTDQYRLIIKGQELPFDNQEQFEKVCNLVENGSMIYVLQRMKGGSKIADVDTQRAIILQELPNALDAVPTVQKLRECSICMEEAICYKPCCVIMCKSCFINTFVHCGYKFICSVCNRLLNYQKFFTKSEFAISLEQYDDTILLVRNIDFQICTCGSFSINDTMYSKQQCIDCGRWLCFFCNEDWDNNKMENKKYSCGNSCKLENYLTYKLVPTGYNKNLKMPDRRVCPKCKICGWSDVLCKFHTCPSCGHSFCFICLKPEEGADKCPQTYDQSCGEVVKQDYTVFARIGQN